MTIQYALPGVTVSALLIAMAMVSCSGDRPEAMLASAKEYLSKNDNKSAVVQLKNALQKNPDSAEARYLLGKLLLEEGSPASAEVELRKALELKYSPNDALPPMARAMLAQAKFKGVIDEVAKADVKTPEAKADLQTTLGLAYSLMEDLPSARKAIINALAAKADFAPALIAQARLTAGDGDFPGALTLVEQALASEPRNYDGWRLKGDILVALNRTYDGIVALRAALEIRPNYAFAHAALTFALLKQANFAEAAKQLEAMKKVAPESQMTSFVAAQVALSSKDLKKARELSQQLLTTASDNPYALQQAGAIELQLNSLDQAENFLTKSLKARPTLQTTRRLLAVTYLNLGQPAKALSVINPIIGDIEDDAAMLTLAGEVFMQNGQLQNAEATFVKAAKLDPKDPRKKTSLALLRLNKGEAEAAFADLEQIAAADTGVTADLTLINSHLQRGELDKALTAIEALAKKQPLNPLPHNLRGRILLTRQDRAGARKSFEKALDVNPVYFAAANSLATMDIEDRKPDDARKRFEKILAVEARNVAAMLALAELKVRAEGPTDDVAALINKAITTNPDEPQARAALITFYILRKDPKKAISAGQEAMAAIKGNPDIYDALGRAQQAAGETNQALSTYGRLSSLQPNATLPFVRMAEIYASIGNSATAAQNLRRALELKPDLIEAQRALMANYLASGKSANALAIARESQKQRPRDPVGYFLEGEFHAASESWGEAVTAYRSAFKLAPTSETARKVYGAMIAGRDHAEAARFANAWLKDHGNDTAFLAYLAAIADARKDYATAIQYYRSALAQQPENPILLNNLASVSGKAKIPGAIEYAEKANKLMPNNPGIMDTLAFLLADSGETARGVALLAKAVALAPQATVIRFNYARLLAKTGDKVEAKKQLYEISRLGGKFSQSAEFVELAKSL